MAAKKKTAKKAAKKVTAKKAVKKVAKKAPAKKAATKKAVKVAPAKKAAAKKTVKKAAAKKVAAKKAAVKAVVKKAPKVESAPKKPVKISHFAGKQRQRLLDLRDDLVDAMSGVTGEIKSGADGSDASGGGMHQGDAGSDAYDRDFALSVLAKEQDALYEIEQALRRIEKGVYGVCEISGGKIPQARLEAIPFARLTVECQGKWEKEYGNQRFRLPTEVGFSNGRVIDAEGSETVSLDGTRD